MAEREAKRWNSSEHREMGAAAAHPLRQLVAAQLRRDGGANAAALAAALSEQPARIGYQLRVLARVGLVAAVPRRRPNRPLYRLRDEHTWLCELLDGVEE